MVVQSAPLHIKLKQKSKRVHRYYYYGMRSPKPKKDGLLGPNSIVVVHVDFLGKNKHQLQSTCNNAQVPMRCLRAWMPGPQSMPHTGVYEFRGLGFRV